MTTSPTSFRVLDDDIDDAAVDAVVSGRIHAMLPLRTMLSGTTSPSPRYRCGMVP